MNYKKLYQPILFKNPYVCPSCGGILELIKETDISSIFIVNDDGTINEDNGYDEDILSIYTELTCVNCDKHFNAYELCNEKNQIVYTIDKASSLKIIKEKVKKQTKDKPIIYVEDPFYN